MGREKTASLFIRLWAKNPQAFSPSVPKKRINSNKKVFFIIEFKELKTRDEIIFTTFALYSDRGSGYFGILRLYMGFGLKFFCL